MGFNPGDIHFYGRVSTEPQTDNTSVPDQLRNARGWVREAFGFELLPENCHTDSKTGASLDRPALNRLREMLQHGDGRLVVINTQDRISRKLRNIWELVIEAEKHGYQIYTVKENVYLTEDSAESDVVLTIRGYAAQKELEALKRRTLDGKKYKLEVLGEVAGGGIPPYGFRFVKVRKTDGKFATYLEVDEDEAAILRLMRDMVLDGASCQKVAEWLNEHEVPTPGSARGRRSRQWWQGSVHRILTNDTPYGTYRWRDIEVEIPAILSLDDRHQIRACLDEMRKAGRYERKYQYLLSGLLRCDLCNYGFIGMSTVHAGRRYAYYACGGRYHWKEFGMGGPCAAVNFRAEAVEAAVWDELAAIIRRPERLSKILSADHRHRRVELAEEMERIEALIDSHRNEQKAVMRQYAQGPHAHLAHELIEDIESQIRASQERQTQITEQIRGLDHWQSRSQELQYQLVAWRHVIDRPDLPFKFRRQLVKKFVREIRVNGDSLLVYLDLAPPEGTILSDNDSVLTARLIVEVQARDPVGVL